MLLMDMYGERPKQITEAVNQAVTPQDNKTNQLATYPGTEAPTPGWFDGSLSAIYEGPASAWYETKSAVQGTIADWDFVDEDYREELDEWARENTQRAKSFEPDPLTTGTVAQIIYGVGKDLTKFAMAAPVGAAVAAGGTAAGVAAAPLLGTIATASLFGANVRESESQKLQLQGVDEKTADKAGTVQGVMAAAGVFIPGGIGARRAVNAAYGAGVNVLTNANEMAAVNKILEDANYDDVAEQYDWSDPMNAAVSAIFGGATGAVMGRSARRVKPIEADAARVRATQIENTANLPVNVNDGEQVSAGYKAQNEVKKAVDNKTKPTVTPDSVSDERVAELKQASEKKMAEAVKQNGNVLQNRDRSSKASVTQMKSIAANPDYGRLGFSHSFTDGAPVIAYASDVPEVQLGREDFVVDADGKRYRVRYAVVEADTVATSHRIDGTENPLYGSDEVQKAIAGNARTTGLQEAYRQGTADNYRAEMVGDPLHGIAPEVFEGMEKPILVRIMDDKDVTPNIGDVTNRSSTQQLSLVEQAQTDSQRVDLSALKYDEDGDITVDSVVEFLALLPPEERANLIDANGIPTKPAFDRLNRAIFQAAYGDANATALLDTTEKTGISRLLGAFRQLAPRVLGLEGEMDFRQAMLEVLSEIREAKRSGKKISIADIAAQISTVRSPEADAFLQFIAKNEAEGGGIPRLVEVFSELADFARANTDNAAMGVDLFGEVVQPTRLDLMRKFSDLTGVPIDESKFRPVNDLNDAVKFENRPDVSDQDLLHQTQNKINDIAEEPKFERIVVGKDKNGNEHAVFGVNGNPDLMVIPEGIAGAKPIPVRLQEGTLKGDHIRKHEKEILQAGYKSVEQAIWDVTQNWRWISKGTKKGSLRLLRPLATVDGNQLSRTVLQIEFQEVSGGIYRIGSIYFSKKPIKDEVLFDRQALDHGPLSLESNQPQGWRPPAPSSGNSTTEALKQPSVDSIGQKITDVNTLRVEQRVTEKAEDLLEAKIVQDNLNQINRDPGDPLQQEALQAIDENPTMRIQLDEGDSSITAAEFLRQQEAEAERIKQEAEKGVPEAAACVFLNNGMDQ